MVYEDAKGRLANRAGDRLIFPTARRSILARLLPFKRLPYPVNIVSHYRDVSLRIF